MLLFLNFLLLTILEKNILILTRFVYGLREAADEIRSL